MSGTQLVHVLIVSLLISATIAEPESDYYEIEKNTKPCSPFETVNITDGTFNSDGSITHRYITYKKEHYGIYNYTFNDYKTKVIVPEHRRGCICLYRPCIRNCCRYNQKYDSSRKVCDNADYTRNGFNVTTTYNNTAKAHAFYNSKFGVLFGQQCHGEILQTKEWTLENDEDGIDLLYDNKRLNYTDYCIADEANYAEAFICAEVLIADEDESDFSFGIFMAAILLLGLSFVYLYFKELRKPFYGKCLTAYIIVLTIMYICYFFNMLINFKNINTLFYVLIASLLSSLVWLVLINYDYWQTLRTNKYYLESSKSKVRLITFIFISILIPLAFIGTNHLTADVFPTSFDERIAGLGGSLIVITILPIIFLILSAILLKSTKKTVDAETHDDDDNGIAPINSGVSPKFDIYTLNLIIEIASLILVSALLMLEISPVHSFAVRIIINLVALIHGSILFYVLIWKTKAKELVFKE